LLALAELVVVVAALLLAAAGATGAGAAELAVLATVGPALLAAGGLLPFVVPLDGLL